MAELRRMCFYMLKKNQTELLSDVHGVERETGRGILILCLALSISDVAVITIGVALNIRDVALNSTGLSLNIPTSEYSPNMPTWP